MAAGTSFEASDGFPRLRRCGCSFPAFPVCSDGKAAAVPLWRIKSKAEAAQTTGANQKLIIHQPARKQQRGRRHTT